MRRSTTPSILLSLPIVLILLYACQPNAAEAPVEQEKAFEHISDQQAREVLEKSINAMGGLERWQTRKTLHFTKDYALLMENGEIENAAFQQHDYSYQPAEEIHISWQKGDTSHLLRYADGELSKQINGMLDTAANQQSLLNTVLSATFVANIPWKFLDQGANVSYMGTDTLDTGRAVYVLRVEYNPDEHANHSTPDIWHAYFDQEDYALQAYMVQHADHYSYVVNLSDTIIDGFRFVKKRNSYRVDSLRNILYLRATYAYDDYEVTH